MKTLFIIALAITMWSCGKETVEPEQPISVEQPTIKTVNSTSISGYWINNKTGTYDDNAYITSDGKMYFCRNTNTKTFEQDKSAFFWIEYLVAVNSYNIYTTQNGAIVGLRQANQLTFQTKDNKTLWIFTKKL